MPIWDSRSAQPRYLNIGEGQAWRSRPITPALRRLKQEDHEFEVSLGYIVRPCLKISK
jgi:hypothetical protein